MREALSIPHRANVSDAAPTPSSHRWKPDARGTYFFAFFFGLLTSAGVAGGCSLLGFFRIRHDVPYGSAIISAPGQSRVAPLNAA